MKEVEEQRIGKGRQEKEEERVRLQRIRENKLAIISEKRANRPEKINKVKETILIDKNKRDNKGSIEDIQKKINLSLKIGEKSQKHRTKIY